MESGFCVETMYKYIGQTVTVFTTSGGVSGCGFTGVLISVDCNCIRLIDKIGEAPACPLGSSCCYGSDNNYSYSNNGNCGCGCRNNCGCGSRVSCGNGCGCGSRNSNGWGNGYGNNSYGNPLGAVTEIPLCNVAAFTHNAI